MATHPPDSGRPVGGSAARQHRRRILAVLLGICRNLERLELEPEAREACRQVGRDLQAAFGREARRRGR